MNRRLALSLLIAILATGGFAAQGASSRARLRSLERAAEQNQRLPDGLLRRLRGYERGHLAPVALRGLEGSAACGDYQIWVDDRRSRDGKRLCSMARGPGAPGMAAQLLSESRLRCEKLVAESKSGCICPWKFWNAGDAARLCAALGEGDES